MTCNCGKEHDPKKTCCLCPFCKGDRRLIRNGDWFGLIVCCPHIRIRWYTSKKRLLSDWNHCTPDARLEKKQAALGAIYIAITEIVPEHIQPLLHVRAAELFAETNPEPKEPE